MHARNRMGSGPDQIRSPTPFRPLLSDVAYFREIIAARAPRITRQEAAGDPTP